MSASKAVRACVGPSRSNEPARDMMAEIDAADHPGELLGIGTSGEMPFGDCFVDQLSMALSCRKPEGALLHHSDRGIQCKRHPKAAYSAAE